MKKSLAIIVLVLASVAVNAQSQATKENLYTGNTYDEIVVATDLSVRRNSKENRQGKELLTNVPSGTTSPPGKSTANASKLVSVSDDNKAPPERRKKRSPPAHIQSINARLSEKGTKEYLLRSKSFDNKIST